MRTAQRVLRIASLMYIKSTACADQIGDESDVVCYCVNDGPVFPRVKLIRTTRREADKGLTTQDLIFSGRPGRNYAIDGRATII